MSSYDPFDSSSSEEDVFIAGIYNYYFDELLEDDEVIRTRAAALNRDRTAAHTRLFNDYFADESVYDLDSFKRRFRLSRHLFLRISNAIESRYPFFQQKYDARGRLGFSGLQKCTAAMRLMAYGNTADSVDEYLQMSERTARECMYRFARGVVEIFGDIYLRKPNTNDVQNLYAAHEERHGLPGMLGSLDCTNWNWRNCPQAWRGQYTGGHHGVPCLVLEAVASQDLWIWHAFFGVAGSNNDINVLDQSPIFDDMLTGQAPDAPFEVNGNNYRFGYYLCDRIYPRYATIVKSFRVVDGLVEERFKKRQESARKDVERAFGVLKSKWHIVNNPTRPFHIDNLRSIMYACCIMHNMVIEEEGRHICPYVADAPRHSLYVPGTTEYLHRVVDIQDGNVHDQLQLDLATHVFYNPMNQDDVVEDDVVEEDVVAEELADPFVDVEDDDLEPDEDLDDYDDVIDDDD